MVILWSLMLAYASYHLGEYNAKIFLWAKTEPFIKTAVDMSSGGDQEKYRAYLEWLKKNWQTIIIKKIPIDHPKQLESKTLEVQGVRPPQSDTSCKIDKDK